MVTMGQFAVRGRAVLAGLATLAVALGVAIGAAAPAAAATSTTSENLSCEVAPGTLNVPATLPVSVTTSATDNAIADVTPITLTMTPSVTLPASLVSSVFTALGATELSATVTGLAVSATNASPTSIDVPAFGVTDAPLSSGQSLTLSPTSAITLGPWDATTAGSNAVFALGAAPDAPAGIQIQFTAITATGTNALGPLSIDCTNSPVTIATVTVPPPVSALIVAPATQTVPANTTATFTATNGAGTAVDVQWQSSTDGSTWTDIAGAADTSTLSFVASSTDAPYYRAVLTGTTDGDPSNTATLTVEVCGDISPAITTQPAGTSVTAGQTATFTAAAVLQPCELGPISTAWQVSTDGGNTWTAIAGATTPTLTLTNTTLAQNGYEYRAAFGSPAASPVDTTAATLTVVAPAALPAVTSLLPSSGGAYSLVLIEGSNLAHATQVDFGAGHKAFFLGLGGHVILALAPPQPSGTVADVTVTTRAGTSATSSADRFTYK